jgi:hypothetical protein
MIYITYVRNDLQVSDERYGSNSGWRDFPPVASAALSQAFKDGKTSSRITINDKPVLVDFVDMTQRYLESSAQTTPIYGKAKLVDGFDIQTVFDAEKRLSLDLPQHKLLIKNAIKMLQSRPNDAPLHMDHIFSALSLLLNLITGNVDAFVEVGCWNISIFFMNFSIFEEFLMKIFNI